MYSMVFIKTLLRSTLAAFVMLFAFASNGQVIVVGPDREAFLEKESPTPEQAQAARDAQDLELAQAYYENQISELETKHGAYHGEIAESLFSLANIYQAKNENKLALDTLMHSLEVKRMSYGLYNEIQFPVVEQLITLNRTLRDWNKLDESLDYLFWLSRRVYGERSPKLLPVIESVVYWKYEAIMNNLLGNSEKQFRIAQRAVREAEDILKLHPDKADHVRYISLPVEDIEKRIRQAERNLVRIP